MVYSAYAHCALGRPLRASTRVEAALRLARSLDHPHSLAFALAFACSLAYFRREPALAVEPLQQLVALASKERFQHWLLGAAPLEAWIQVESGDHAAAIARLRQVDGLGATPHRTDVQAIFWKCIAGEVFLRADRPAEALPLLDEIVATLESRPTRLWWMAEAYRLRGCVLVTLDRSESALADLLRAADQARKSGARLFLLRALVDRLRQFPHDPETPAVQRELAALYTSFDEGYDLRDLSAARALLDGSTPVVTR